jgi:malonate transporter and related proteins
VIELLILVAPIFILIVLGFMTAWLKITDETTTKGLSDFVIYFATPALLFKLIVYNDLPSELPWGYLASYYIGVIIAWFAVSFITYKILRASWGDSVVAGLSTGQGNTVMIGIPLLIKVYGEAAAAPIAMLLAVNLPFTMTVATILLEGGRAGNGKEALKNFILGLVTHPILIGIFAGLLWKNSHFPVPAIAKNVLDMLSVCAVPTSLVALGMCLKEYGFKAKIAPLMVVTVSKLALHPALTFILAHFVFKLPPLWVGSAVIFAAMPAGINAFLFAKRYGEGEELASSAVALTTVLSVFTILGWLSFLPK